MTHRFAAIGTLILLAPALAAASSWQALERVPGTTPVLVEVKGKPRAYVRLSSAGAVEIPVDGPARVRIVTRVVLGAGAPRTVNYTIRASLAGKPIGASRTESSAAPAASIPGSTAVLCKSRTLIVEVPAGRHRIELAVEGAADVLARILVSAPGRSAGEAYVSLTPADAPRSVTLSEGERLIPYYSVLPRANVRIRVVGPTTLEISSRLDFDATMRGAQRYRLRVLVNGKTSKTPEFTTTKSATGRYVDLKDRVPSKVSRFTVSIPSGGHDVTVELLQPTHGSVEIHARIPQPSVGNEE